MSEHLKSHDPVDVFTLQIQNFYLGPEFSSNEVLRASETISLSVDDFKKLKPLQKNALCKNLSLPTDLVKAMDGENLEDSLMNEVNAVIRNYINACFYREENVIDKAVEDLENGKIIGWFQGRMEAGPRALGNRSILAHPNIAQIKDIVNEKIKFRQKWRPFCPSVLDEWKDELFEVATESKFMINTFKVKEKMYRIASEVVHVDGTARPQFVKESDNKIFHELLTKFHKKTDCPVLLNTSMNIKGEPICMTPDHAMKLFLCTEIDNLYINEYCLTRI